jgi:hypothetical protein
MCHGRCGSKGKGRAQALQRISCHSIWSIYNVCPFELFLVFVLHLRDSSQSKKKVHILV